MPNDIDSPPGDQASLRAELAALAEATRDLAKQMTAVARTQANAYALQRFESLGPERILRFLHADREVAMYLPYGAVDIVQQRVLTGNGFFEGGELHAAAGLMPADPVIIDAGANIGNHTVFFGLFCGAAEIVAFEPMRHTFAILERNVALNGLDKVRCVNAALGAAPGRARLSSYKASNMGATSVRLGADGAYPVTTIDALEMPKVDFIKIDVEGVHVEVLKGAAETLRRCRPLVWVEMRKKHHEYAQGDAALRGMGYVQRHVLSSDDYVYGPAD